LIATLAGFRFAVFDDARIQQDGDAWLARRSNQAAAIVKAMVTGREA
jgi:hypothetical protein